MDGIHGSDSVFEVQDSGGVYRDLSSYLTQDGLAREADLPDTTTKGAAAKDYSPGLLDGSIELEGLFDATLDGYLAGILNVKRGWKWYPAGNTTGFPLKTGNGILKSYEVESPVDGSVTISGEFQLCGDVTNGVAA